MPDPILRPTRSPRISASLPSFPNLILEVVVQLRPITDVRLHLRAKPRSPTPHPPTGAPKEDGFLVSSTIPISICFFAFPGGPRRERQNRRKSSPTTSRKNPSPSFSKTSMATGNRERGYLSKHSTSNSVVDL
jgi:hypothetical protein